MNTQQRRAARYQHIAALIEDACKDIYVTQGVEEVIDELGRAAEIFRVAQVHVHNEITAQQLAH